MKHVLRTLHDNGLIACVPHLITEVLLWKRIKGFSVHIVFEENSDRDYIVFEKLRFQNGFPPYGNTKAMFQIPPVWRAFCQKLRFHDGFNVDYNEPKRRNNAAFSNFSAIVCAGDMDSFTLISPLISTECETYEWNFRAFQRAMIAFVY